MRSVIALFLLVIVVGRAGGQGCPDSMGIAASGDDSVGVARSESVSDSLLGPRLRGVGLRFRRQGDLSGGDVGMTMMDPTPKPVQHPKWLLYTAEATSQGLALYAAYQAGSTPAMAAVAAMTATQGVVGRGIRAMVSSPVPSPTEGFTLGVRDLELLRAIWRTHTDGVRSTRPEIYRRMPKGWTFDGLGDELKGLKKRGLVTESKGIYVATVSAGEALQALAVGRGAGMTEEERREWIERLSEATDGGRSD